MFEPWQMSRLLIAGTKDVMPGVIAELYRRRLFHIEDYVGQEEYAGFRLGMPLPGATEASDDLLKIRAATNAFGIHDEGVPAPHPLSPAELRRSLQTELPEVDAQADELVTRRTRLETRQKDLETRIAELEPFASVPIPMDLYRGYETVAVFAGHVPADVAITAVHEKAYVGGKKGGFLVVFTPIGDRDAVERQLLDSGFAAVRIPDETGMPADAIARYQAERASIEKELEGVGRQLEGLSELHASFLLAADELLSAEVEQAEAPLRFAVTDQTFVAEGWVPTVDVSDIKASLERTTGGKIHVEELPIDYDHDAVPVEYHNPTLARPAEMFVDLMARPKYQEIDPTLFVAIVFPLFFGMIVGDVGYGLIFLALSLGLRKVFKTEGWILLLDNLLIGSIVTIAFGVIYSEFFGFELPWAPLIFSRHLGIGGAAEAGAHGPDAAAMLIVAIWIGIIHITLGRILSIVNHARMDHGSHRRKAIVAQTGWLAFMWGLIVTIWSMYAIPLMFDLTKLGDVVAPIGLRPFGIIGIVMILYGMVAIAQENALDLLELPTVISHVLSYARLLAVGLSSVAIALVINFIALDMMIRPQLGALSAVGVVLIIVGILVLVVGHVVNTFLGILEAGLNAIRLHYVEFFTKFYKGGGRKYNPFGMKRLYTSEE
ncbi:MAG: V-type ATP synthase subunit I [Methanospirillum sp.]